MPANLRGRPSRTWPPSPAPWSPSATSPRGTSSAQRLRRWTWIDEFGQDDVPAMDGLDVPYTNNQRSAGLIGRFRGVSARRIPAFCEMNDRLPGLLAQDDDRTGNLLG